MKQTRDHESEVKGDYSMGDVKHVDTEWDSVEHDNECWGRTSTLRIVV